MKILITGATGLIGSSLTRQLLHLSHELTLLTRNVAKARDKFGDRLSYWASLDEQRSLDGFDAVINLAGEPIADKRWSKAQKELLCRSRWDLTERLATLIAASNTPPSVLISGSAVGYYGDQGQAVVTEEEPRTMNLLTNCANAGRLWPYGRKVATRAFACCVPALSCRPKGEHWRKCYHHSVWV